MRAYLKLLQLYFPAFLKKKKLTRLFSITGNAFGCEAPSTRGLTFEQCLERYALFTKQQAELFLEKPSDIDSIKDKLFQGAYQLGTDLKREFHIVSSAEVLLMMKIIYGLLGIDFKNTSENEIMMERCFFSRYYSPEICQVISALDEGLAAGLSGGGKLCFFQRITEGKSCCRANFVFGES